MHYPIVNPSIPRTKGPYSQVVRVDQLLFVSGQASIDPATGEVIGGSFETQARQAFENLSAALQAAGSGLKRLGVTLHVRPLKGDLLICLEEEDELRKKLNRCAPLTSPTNHLRCLRPSFPQTF